MISGHNRSRNIHCLFVYHFSEKQCESTEFFRQHISLFSLTTDLSMKTEKDS